MNLYDLLDPADLGTALESGYVRRQSHPTLPLAILNYTQKAQFDRVWTPTTRTCRGLIFDEQTLEIVARPFPKFFNYGQEEAAELDLAAPAETTEKMDGSLGILYPTPTGYAIATRGSFSSDQALHATERLRDYVCDDLFEPPHDGWTYLFEIVYPENRIVCDYGNLDDLVLLAVLRIADGRPVVDRDDHWPGPRVETHPYLTLAEALAAEPRPGSEGLVVYLPDQNERVKIKQDDYVALHRILTGTNARHVWEFAAVRACAQLIREAKHWGSYLGIDPVRAAEILEIGDDWLETSGIPDEFFGWVRDLTDGFQERVGQDVVAGLRIAARAESIADRRTRYEFVLAEAGPLVREVMRMAEPDAGTRTLDETRLRAWREACPEPSAPFARTEDVA